MGTSRGIAIVGLSTLPRAGWRTDISAAVAVVRDRPYLWLLGIIGFSLRGGILLLTLPIIILPTQVEVRLALGNNLDSTGLTDGFWLLVVGMTVLTLVALLSILFALARVEIATFSQLVHDPHSADQRSDIAPRSFGRGGRRTLASRLYVIKSTALLVVLISAIPLAAAIGDVATREIVAPTSSDPIYLRVLGQLREPILLVIGVIFVVEFVSATLSRRVLIRSAGLTRRGTFTAHPLRLVLAAIFGWALFFGALAIAVWTTGIAWHTARSVFLSAGWSTQAEQVLALLGAAILLGAVFGLALLVCGIASAIRASVWSLASLR